MPFPRFPKCDCGWHAEDLAGKDLPPDALANPLAYVPPAVQFTPAMSAMAARYWAHDIDWRYYPAFQAAAYLGPRTAERHAQRREQYQAIKRTAESEGFVIPDVLTELYMSDAYVDRLHHGCVMLQLSEQIVRLPADPQFALLLFLVEDQGKCWHLLLSTDGTHTVVTADEAFGRFLGNPPGYVPKWHITQCADSIEPLLLHFFMDSARSNSQHLERLTEYFAEHPE